MKKYVIVMMFVSLLMVTGCGKQASVTNIVTSSGQDILTWSNVSLCIPENLENIQVFQMDTLVKNCSTKKEEGKFIDGLGGVYPEYDIMNNSIVIAVFDETNIGDNTIACQDANGLKYIADDKTKTGWYSQIPEIPGFAVLPKVFGKGLINQIADKIYPDSMRCNEKNTDCMSMVDYGGRTNGTDYFVAGYRNTRNTNFMGTGTNPDRIKYYVINDKVYYPGINTDGFGIMQQSKRNLVSIQNNKIIVSRIKNGLVIGNPETMDPSKLKSNFLLETCEIDL